MYKNYFFLNRMVIELNPLLSGFFLTELFSQEKDHLILHFSLNGKDSNLIISASQNSPHVLLRGEFHRAKKNTMNFFEEFLPAQLNDIQIATDDRIIKFRFNTFDLYFMIRGKDTNLILIDQHQEFASFKKIEEQDRYRFKSELQQKFYSYYFHKPDLDSIAEDNIDFYAAARSRFPFLGKEIMFEVKRRMQENSLHEFKLHLNDIVNEIETDNISVVYDKALNKIAFQPEDFYKSPEAEEEFFKSYNEALQRYFIRVYQTEKEIKLKSAIAKHLENSSTRLISKISNLEITLNKPSREETFRQTGSLLLANIHTLRKGLKEIEVRDYITGDNVKIKLDEKLDAKGNVDRYFEKAKNEKQSRISLALLAENLHKEYENIKRMNVKFENAKKINEYTEIMEELNISEGNKTPSNREESFNFKHYVIENKYHVYVGRDSKNNDLLTVKFAKQNDYWFHARGVSGSHVVLRVENTKEVVPKNIIKKAASLAAYHSKAKTSKMAPVAFTFKKYVTKKKGMEPGKVSLLKEEVVLVPPEIPKDCEYIS